MLNKSIQSTYINVFISISHSIDKYLNQLNTINKLSTSNNEHLKYKVLYDTTLNELQDLNQTIQIQTPIDLYLEKVRVLSYYKFNDFSRVILNKNDLDTSKIYSLITFDGYSAGIVLHKNDNSIAYLNENSKCNYTVFIGKNNVPGITNGIDESGNIIIKFVPIWQEVNIGDEVITSSMDNIFPYGIKVGKVISIDIQDNIQEVVITPYAKNFGNRNYYIYGKDLEPKTTKTTKKDS